ncbi:hypothetical protein [uncultured Arcobacter sp.]|uniref:hypothetical protein n=1 Tax=uncultured Arcobacter sp. TaxID=165434 RepID=UPI00261289EB|nr:hypothetical protein [uncultured Arcobacter sp.]
MNFFKKIINSLNQMSSPIYTFNAHSSELSFLLPNDEKIDFTLDKFDVKTRHDPYAIDAYTFNNPDIYFEYIHLDSVCSWNGLARGYFVSLLQKTIKEELELQERFEFGHYEFSTYKTSKNSYIHLICIWEVNKEVFIIDKKGVLYKNFINLLDSDYKYEFTDKKMYELDAEISLVKQNSLNQYFNASGD